LQIAGLRVMSETFCARMPRGAGVFQPSQMPYFGEAALAALAGADLMVGGRRRQPATGSYPTKPPAPCVLQPDGFVGRASPLAGRRLATAVR
jgi:acetolactate synthase-1/2/3 large subunit